MNQPSPAIVAQEGVRRLPRWGLLLFCAIYILAGFVWRDPWKGDDITSFGYMLELARGHASWLKPGMLGESANFHTLLPYWLGAWAIQISPAWMTASQAVRLVFMAVLALTLLGCWFSIYYLARSRAAQPVSFAFGGEARPADYARAVADGGLLALFVLFVILYMAGVGQWLCIAFGVTSASALVWLTFHLNGKFGEHGLMKLLAGKRHPRYLIHRKRVFRLFTKRKKKQP